MTSLGKHQLRPSSPTPHPVLPRHTQEQKSAGDKPRGTSQPRERLLGKEGVNRAAQMTLRWFRELSPGPSDARVVALPTPTRRPRAGPPTRAHRTTPGLVEKGTDHFIWNEHIDAKTNYYDRWFHDNHPINT